MTALPLSRIGAAAGDGTTITIPAGHQAGDLLVIFAFRGATTAPSLPAGWSGLTSASSGASSFRVGRKLAISGADTSGTWTNATGLCCAVYRGASSRDTTAALVLWSPTVGANTGTGTTVDYGTAGTKVLFNPSGGTWLVGFAATKTTDSTLETAPAGMTNAATAVGAATEYAVHDTNGPYISGGGWPQTSVAVGGTSAEWRSFVVEILTDYTPGPAGNRPAMFKPGNAR